MNVQNFDILYSDFRKNFDIYRYTDADLKAEIIKRVKDDNKEDDVFLFRFRMVVFVFDISNGNISYQGYEK